MRLVPLVVNGKHDFYKKVVADGGEGIMLKDVKGTYIPEGRPKSMYKVKRFEEVDAFVSGGNPGEAGKGWERLIGDIEFSAYTETGKIHMVAKPSNLELSARIEATVCGNCGGALDVSHENQGGKRVILGTKCTQCSRINPLPVLNPAWKKRVACIQGQEWTARVFRLKHAFIERWRFEGVDAKAAEDCKINLRDVQHRFERAAASYEE